MAKITLSVIKADIGGYVGHSSSHPDILKKAEEMLSNAKEKGLLIDFCVMHCGDDLELIMTHNKGENASEIHELAWNTFKSCADLAKEMKLYGAGQDILSETFSGNVKGMGPGVAEMEFEERPSEPVLIFMGDKTSPGAWNLPLYKIFADPFNTIGLVIDPALHDGFKFEVYNPHTSEVVIFSAPEEIYDMLVFIGAKEHYLIRRVWRKDGLIAAVGSVQKLALIAGRYVGKDDPVLIVRTQHGLPAVGEVLEAFSTPFLVAGWMRGSHHGPLMPTSFKYATPSRFDGPPRVICAGFQLSGGKLIGPRDMFDDPSFDDVRRTAQFITDYMRRHGPFEPQRLPLEDMEYTTLPQVRKKLEGRFKKEE